MGAWNGDTRLYPPTGDTISAVDCLASLDWRTIVPMDTLLLNPASGKDRRDWGYLYQITNGETGKGDICKWLTQKGWAPGAPTKKWRLPTSREFGESNTNHSFSAWGAGTNEAAVAAGTNTIGTGRSLTNVSPNVFFPASGFRHLSTGDVSNFGTFGDYWSSSPVGSSSTNSYYLHFTSGGVYPASNYTRTHGFPVRCVVE